MSPFFVLMDGAWPQAEAYLCRPLLGHRKGRPELLPWIAVAQGVAGGAFDLVRRDSVSSDQARALIAQAQKHLESQAVNWQVAEQKGWLFKKPAMLRAIVSQPPGMTPDPTDDLSSEQILNPTALAQAASLLGTSELIAVCPKRGWLLVAPGAAGEFPQMMKMHQAGSGIFERAEKLALSPYGFFLRDGVLRGANVLEKSGGFMHLAEPQESEWLL